MKNLFSGIATKANTISVNTKAKTNILGKCTAFGIPVAVASTSLIFADGGFDEVATKLKDLFIKLYNAIKGALTVVCIAIIAICLLLRIISKDPRKVEEATAWAKRVVITWGIFMLLGLLITFMSDFGGDSTVDDLGSI